MENVMIVIGTIIGIGLITYLLIKGKIGSGSYATLFICVILSSLALYGFPRLKELDLKNWKLVLFEMREVKKDIYAKAETMKKLGEEVARLTVFNITKVGRFATPDLQEEMLGARDSVYAILREVGSDEDSIKEITNQIDSTVLYDLEIDVYRKVEEITHNMLKAGRKIDRGKIINETKKMVLEEYDREALIKYLKEQDVYNEEIESLLYQVDSFIKNKRLLKNGDTPGRDKL